ncbi:glucose-6-phosphate dehydrogenase assembly protein OpcA [Deinococcus yavapaiensis]|uniref:Glucose-6-phosphate dehydrogenase assembly protein OpcA n=1 Tax=Deinococcus yavapaiensis KR-236 TaxID=694435 RepID=A0A318SEL7_9DEIO|nr:glucose-6-phosphate dehydrogenase assembly protein OpcA [Deinococcus yavapaiensis]PYE56227.1 glucose-6-phosphate dehydrogenase assembly protein OpcA [Deinococcus yavapaiensis KR-236]
MPGNLQPLGPVKTDVRGATNALESLWDETHVESRAYTGNIVALTRSRSLPRVEEALATLGGRYAGRQIIGVMDGDETVDVTVSLVPQKGGYVERLVLDANEEQLQGAILPLLRPATVNHVWWATTERPGGALLAELAELADQIIANALSLDLGPLGPHCSLTDLGWARTSGWREALAQLFDPHEAAAALPALRQLTLRYAGDNDLPARLYAGWAATKLGWRDAEGVVIEADPASSRENGDLSFVRLSGDGAEFQLTSDQGNLVRSTSVYGSVRREAELYLPALSIGEGLAFVMAQPEQNENFVSALDFARRLP